MKQRGVVWFRKSILLKFDLKKNIIYYKGANTKIDLTRMKSVLGIVPTEFRKTIIDMANSLIQFGLVKKPEN